MRRYNDYELIYIYKSERCESALNILMSKYRPLIYKNIYQYGVEQKYFDDFFQESLIILYSSILKFEERYNKTFTRYFELILKRRILYLKKQTPQYELHEDFSIYGNYEEEIELNYDNLTDFEYKVFQKYFVENQKISFIAKSEGKTNKQIYNTIYRIRDKYKNNML